MSGRWPQPIIVLALSSAVTSLDFTIIYLAIPSVQTAFSATVTDTQWVAAAYAVAYGGFLLLGGRLADTYGPRRCFITGMLGFGVSSALGALAPSLGVLLASRVGQGLSAAVLFPATLALLHQTYPGSSEKRRALAIWAAAGSGGLIAGTVLGGVLTELAGWRGVMWVNVPLVLVGLILASLSLTSDPARGDLSKVSISSWVSAVAVAVITASVCLLAVRAEVWTLGWQSWTVLAVIGCAVLVARVLARATGASLVPARVLADPNVRSATLLGTAFMGAFGTVYFLVSLDLQTVRGIPSVLAGIAMIPGSLGGIVGSFLAARLLSAYPPKVVSCWAMIAGGVGLGVIASVTAAPLPMLLVGLGLASIAQGVAYAAIFALAGRTVYQREQGVATGVVSTGQQIGSAVGLAVAALCVQSAATALLDMESGIVLALALAGAVVLLSGVIAYARLRWSHEDRRNGPS